MTPEVLLDEEALRREVKRLGGEISSGHPDGVVMVCVLKGALIFFADLVRAVDVPVQVDFMSISRFEPDSGRVRILHDLRSDVSGRDVVMVEDIVDTGLTLTYLMEQMRSREPRSLEACALIDRAERRIVPVELRYRGIEVAGDVFAVGYGLHHRDLYRNLPFVARGNPDELRAEPGRYVADLYPRPGQVAGTQVAAGPEA